MQGPRMGSGLMLVFGVIAGLMTVLGVLYSPVTLGVAVPFAVASAILWYQASGRLYRRVRRRPDPGRAAGRRDASTGPRGPRFGDSQFRDARAGGSGFQGGRFGDDRVGNDRFEDGRFRGGATGNTRGAARERAESSGLSHREASRILDVEADASQRDIRRAYRERAKDLHPDRGGDDEAFKRVTRAYDRLRE